MKSAFAKGDFELFVGKLFSRNPFATTPLCKKDNL